MNDLPLDVVHLISKVLPDKDYASFYLACKIIAGVLKSKKRDRINRELERVARAKGWGSRLEYLGSREWFEYLGSRAWFDASCVWYSFLVFGKNVYSSVLMVSRDGAPKRDADVFSYNHETDYVRCNFDDSHASDKRIITKYSEENEEDNFHYYYMDSP